MRYAGVDEVGLGALAGPISTCCVAIDADVRFSSLKKWWPLQGVKDSKKTTFPQRLALMPRLIEFLLEAGASVGIEDVLPADIDIFGYSEALHRAHVGAVRNAYADQPFDLLIIDGSNGLRGNDIHHVEQRVAPKADNDYWVVAAASIIAKVHRDAMMIEMHDDYAMYGFAQNMGYTGGGKDTSVHVAALRKYGLSPHHRKIACRTVLSSR